MKTFTVFSCFIILNVLVVSTAASQQDSNKSKFSARIDSIIENVFERFDDKLGTYIFREEPSDNYYNNVDTEFTNTGIDNSPNESVNRHRNYHTSSFYSINPDHGIVRNTYPSFPWEEIDDNILFRYNRVEGLFLGLNFPQKYYWEEPKLTLFASGGYGFKSHRWRGGIGAAQQFGFEKSILEFGVEGHNLTDSRDQWLVELDENNIASLLTRDDYRDYFGRKGISVWTGTYKRWLKTDMQFQLSYLNDQYESLERKTNWSIFGGDKLFRANPAVTEGRMKSILATFRAHSTESQRIFTSGWSAALSVEVAGKSFDGDYDFNSYTIDLRRYQPLGRYNNLNLRLRASSATGDVPLQKSFDIGGLGTVPAFRFKEFSGNRMLLANAEYIVNGKMFDDVDFFPSWLLRNLNVIFFADAGFVSSADKNLSPFDGYKSLNSKTLRSDWGIGIGTRDAKFRIGFAWRTDVSSSPMVFIRLNRPF